MTDEYQFSARWFDSENIVWKSFFKQQAPRRILEIGAFEGLCTTFMIEQFASQWHKDTSPSLPGGEIHCIDTWEGGEEHKAMGIQMSDVEHRFLHNISVAKEKVGFDVPVFIHKGTSDKQLVKLLHEGKENYFDLIYIDGSHQAADVLVDAVLSFKLLKIGGFIAFDDYLWFASPSDDIAHCPKPAIDAFTTIFHKKLRFLVNAPLYQVYIQKVSD